MLKILLRLAIAFLIILLFIVLIINLNPYKLLSLIKNSDWSILSLILLTNFLAIIFFFLAWHFLLIKLEKISLYESFKSTCIAIFFNLIIPSFSLSGEYARIVYLNRYHDIPNEKLLAILSINKFQYGLAMIIFFVFGLLLMFFSNIKFFALLFSLLIVIFLIITLFLLIAFPNILKKVIIFILERLAKINTRINDRYESLIEKSNKFVDEFSFYGRYLLKSSHSILTLFLMILQWLFNSISFYLAFIALGYPQNLGVLVFTFPIISFLTTTAIFVPANVGIVEPIMIAIYSGFGIDPLISAAAILLARTIIIVEDLFLSLPFVISMGIKSKLFL